MRNLRTRKANTDQAKAEARYAEACERALASYALATALLTGPRVTDRTVIL
jgi:hypothetical protein